MLKIEGHYLFHLPVAVVYEALRDETLIREALPGRVHFRMTSPTHYEAAMELDAGRFGGRYEGSLDVVATEPLRFYELEARGTGRGRFVQARGRVELTALAPDQTEVHYIGETDALDSSNRFIRMAAAPIAAHFANRGLDHLERLLLTKQAGSL